MGKSNWRHCGTMVFAACALVGASEAVETVVLNMFLQWRPPSPPAAPIAVIALRSTPHISVQPSLRDQVVALLEYFGEKPVEEWPLIIGIDILLQPPSEAFLAPPPTGDSIATLVPKLGNVVLAVTADNDHPIEMSQWPLLQPHLLSTANAIAPAGTVGLTLVNSPRTAPLISGAAGVGLANLSIRQATGGLTMTIPAFMALNPPAGIRSSEPQWIPTLPLAMACAGTCAAPIDRCMSVEGSGISFSPATTRPYPLTPDGQLLINFRRRFAGPAALAPTGSNSAKNAESSVHAPDFLEFIFPFRVTHPSLQGEASSREG